MGRSPWGVCTWLYVLAYNRDMAVPVGPRVLVPEANDMAQLMDHDAKLVTVLADGDGLGAPTSATHVGAAPGGRGQLRGVVPSWGSASTQGPGQAAGGVQGCRGGGDGPEHPMRRCMPGSEPYQWVMPIAGRGHGQAQLRAAGVP